MIKRAGSVLLVLFLINLLNFLDRQLPGALAEPIRHEFALSDTALGLLSTVFTLMYAAVGLPLGYLADRWHRPRLIAAGVAVWSLFTLAGALARNYVALFVARIGVGVGEASCSPAAQSLIGDLFPQNQRARAMAAFMVGLPLGIFLAFLGLKVHPGGVLPAMLSIGTAMMLLYVYYATVYAAIQEVVEPGSRGLAVGLYFFAMYVLGASAGPVATGRLSDHFARQAMQAAGSAQMQESFKASGLQVAMFIIPFISTVCALVLFAASRTVAADVLRLRGKMIAPISV